MVQNSIVGLRVATGAPSDSKPAARLVATQPATFLGIVTVVGLVCLVTGPHSTVVCSSTPNDEMCMVLIGSSGGWRQTECCLLLSIWFPVGDGDTRVDIEPYGVVGKMRTIIDKLLPRWMERSLQLLAPDSIISDYCIYPVTPTSVSVSHCHFLFSFAGGPWVSKGGRRSRKRSGGDSPPTAPLAC